MCIGWDRLDRMRRWKVQSAQQIQLRRVPRRLQMSFQKCSSCCMQPVVRRAILSPWPSLMLHLPRRQGVSNCRLNAHRLRGWQIRRVRITLLHALPRRLQMPYHY
ncbi:hypothetical protein FGO68_gene16773 [Halteria grandinella]|uniref:Uncharacterized protein n=1 Tax=Halteria grandinella TaxID=5974 RepID=A0A8J8TB22_HALGN|nr:hypothetical protein FGO68_gene16773 [Halteria grandinella]